MEDHAESEANPPSPEGLADPGDKCPHLSVLFGAAVGNNLTVELKNHFRACDDCRRKYDLAVSSVDDVSKVELEKPFWDSADFRVPVIRNSEGGQIRSLTGKLVLLILLEPAQDRSSWGTRCRVNCQGRSREIWPANISSKSLCSWSRMRPVSLEILGQARDEITFEWDGWGDGIRYIGFAMYPGEVQRSSVLLRKFEKVARAREMVRYGGDGVKAIEQLRHQFDKALRIKLQSLKGVEPHILRQNLDLALDETWAMALEEVPNLGPNPDDWLLKTAARNLLDILENQLGAIQERESVFINIMEGGLRTHSVIDKPLETSF